MGTEAKKKQKATHEDTQQKIEQKTNTQKRTSQRAQEMQNRTTVEHDSRMRIGVKEMRYFG